MTPEQIEELERLDKERTHTQHGWWCGPLHVYHSSFGPIGEPETHTKVKVDGVPDEDGMMDVWAGDPYNVDDARPLVCECCNQKDAAFISAIANAAPAIIVDWRRMREALEEAEEALRRIVQWCEAYPLDIFPEPDMARARAGLAAIGITLDAVSASNMRHALTGVAKIARAALEPKP